MPGPGWFIRCRVQGYPMTMKIGKRDIEALLSGEKDLRSYFELDPTAGTVQVFGVRTSSNPDYLIRALYESFESTQNRTLAIQMIRKLYRSVGLGARGLYSFLEKQDVHLSPSEFVHFVFLLQHQQGWGAPVAVSLENDQIRIKTSQTFESEVLRDWHMRVCGIHTGWTEGILQAVTGSEWVCEEVRCHAAGDDACEFVATKKEISWNERALSIREGTRSITEFMEFHPIEGRITLIDEPVVIIPSTIFSTLYHSMSRIVGEAAAGGVITYHAYQELGAQYISLCRSKGVSDPESLIQMSLAIFTQMGWFKTEKMDWDEATRQKTIIISNSAEAEAFGPAEKPVCHGITGLLAGFVSAAYHVRVQAKEVHCRANGDPFCEFVIRDRPHEN